MKFSDHKLLPAPMQLASFIDVLLVLLMFFILSYQFAADETELDVAVPTAQQGAEPTRPQGEIIINVMADGRMRVEGTDYDMAQLEQKLKNIAKLYDKQPVRIRGDGKVPYERIVEVIDTCQKAGIWNISFATKPPQAS